MPLLRSLRKNLDVWNYKRFGSYGAYPETRKRTFVTSLNHVGIRPQRKPRTDRKRNSRFRAAGSWLAAP